MSSPVQPSLCASSHRIRDWGIVLVIWGVCAIIDVGWLWLDHTEPAWDQGAHLTTAMNYWRVFQFPHRFSSAWWGDLWSQSPTYRGPWVYVLTVPWFALFGQSSDAAIGVNQLFSALLFFAVYGMGCRLFNRRIALWSVGFCALSSTLAFTQVEYLLDYGITATLVAILAGLTFWWTTDHPPATWGWSVGTGLMLGAAVLTKPTNVLFLLMPGLWLVARFIRQRQWYRGWQMLLMGTIAALMSVPWIQKNWLTLITSMLNSNSVGQREGDPSSATWAGWGYYIERLPDLVSWPLLLAAIATMGWLILKRGRDRAFSFAPLPAADRWLLSYVVGFYVLCSLATNKDLRFILPITPIVIMLLVRFVDQLPRPWGNSVRWGSAAIAALLLWLALFPSPGSDKLKTHHWAMSNPRYPVQAAVEAVYQANPYQISTVGMLVDTLQIHAFNVDFYGTLKRFQVLGRQLGVRQDAIDQDARALEWYLTKTGHQGSWVNHPIITPLRQQVEADQTHLSLYRTWPLPDNSELRLYHRRQPAVIVSQQPATVTPITKANSAPIQITTVTTPAQAQPGQLIATRYVLQGTWEALHQGTLILSWQNPDLPNADSQLTWIQDHAIGLNQLADSPLAVDPISQFQIEENLFTIPPASLPVGRYTLHAAYLDRRTQQVTPLTLPVAQIQVTQNPMPSALGVVDRVSRLRQLAQFLRQGKLDDVFAQVAPMHQYGPVQAYLETADGAARYRLQQNPHDLASAYTLVLANILQRKPDAAIAGLKTVTQLDPQNPYAWSYLAFVYLYNFQPQLADQALAHVEQLQPNLPELKTLKLVSAILQFRLVQALKTNSAHQTQH